MLPAARYVFALYSIAIVIALMIKDFKTNKEESFDLVLLIPVLIFLINIVGVIK